MTRSLVRRDEAGMSASVEWSLVVPVVVFAVLGIVFGAVWLHASQMARQAAATAADVVSVGGTREAGTRAALRVASGLRDARVAYVAEGAAVRVRVTGLVRTPVGMHTVQGEAAAVSEPR